MVAKARMSLPNLAKWLPPSVPLAPVFGLLVLLLLRVLCMWVGISASSIARVEAIKMAADTRPNTSDAPMLKSDFEAIFAGRGPLL